MSNSSSSSNGLWLDTLRQCFFIPTPTFTEAQLPDQSGRVFIITGGYTGVGLELAKLLYAKNSTVYLAGRSPDKGAAAIKTLKSLHPSSDGRVEYLKLDLADLPTIKASADDFLRKEQRLDVLTNNAGVMTPPVGSKTAQGYELQMGTNCLGPWLFTSYLTPMLQKTAASSPAGSVRVTWAASLATLASPSGGVEFDAQTAGPKIHGNRTTDYAQSKACNVLLSRAYAKRYASSGIITNAWNPGNLQSELQRHQSFVEATITKLFIYNPKLGGYTELFAGWSPEAGLKENEGRYVGPWGRFCVLRSDIGASDEPQEKLWAWCEREAKAYVLPGGESRQVTRDHRWTSMTSGLSPRVSAWCILRLSTCSNSHSLLKHDADLQSLFPITYCTSAARTCLEQVCFLGCILLACCPRGIIYIPVESLSATTSRHWTQTASQVDFDYAQEDRIIVRPIISGRSPSSRTFEPPAIRRLTPAFVSLAVMGKNNCKKTKSGSTSRNGGLNARLIAVVHARHNSSGSLATNNDKRAEVPAKVAESPSIPNNRSSYTPSSDNLQSNLSPPMHPDATGSRPEHKHASQGARTAGDDAGRDQTPGQRVSVDLVAKLSSRLDEVGIPSATVSVIAELLCDYGFLLEKRAESGTEQHAAAFVRHRCNTIAQRFVKHAELIHRNRHTSSANTQDANVESSGLDDGEEVIDESDFTMADVPKVHTFLTAGREFDWLVSRIKVDSSMSSTGETFTSLRRQLCHLMKMGSSFCYKLDWKLVQMKQEQFAKHPDSLIEQANCLVGTAARAQAMSIGEYVAQVWPSMGKSTLGFIDAWLLSSPGTGRFSRSGLSGTTTADGAVSNERNNFTFTAWLDDDGRAVVEIQAEPTLTMEAGEVLCWLQVVCQASPLHDANGKPCKAYCAPRIVIDNALPRECAVQHDFRLCDASKFPRESCWHKMFPRCTVTDGYPIDPRLHDEPGLQITGAAMALFGKVDVVTVFHGQLMMKGSCTMFVPVQRIGRSIVWHFLHNADGDSMAQAEALTVRGRIKSIDFAMISESVHFVGWTPSARILAGKIHLELLPRGALTLCIGSKDVDYDAVYYGGEIARTNYGIEGPTVAVGHMVQVGAKLVSWSQTEVAGCSTNISYAQRIEVASKWNVVFYDTQDHRAWLLTGSCALLYLSGAALTHSAAPNPGRGLNPSDKLQLVDPDKPEYAEATNVLLDHANRNIAIQDDGETKWNFEDLVLLHWKTLDQMRSYQRNSQSTKVGQWELQNPLKARFEGFEFIDIISGTPPRPCHATLPGSRSGWLQAMNDTGAIHILGANFGELIVSTEGSNLTSLPVGEDLLAAPVPILNKMARKYNSPPYSLKLHKGIYWNSPHKSFDTEPSTYRNPHVRGTDAATSPRPIITHFSSHRARRPVEDEIADDDLVRQSPSAAVIIGRADRSVVQSLATMRRRLTSYLPRSAA
nr:putative oxidoreductase [Quercus suber]